MLYCQLQTKMLCFPNCLFMVHAYKAIKRTFMLPKKLKILYFYFKCTCVAHTLANTTFSRLVEAMIVKVVIVKLLPCLLALSCVTYSHLGLISFSQICTAKQSL